MTFIWFCCEFAFKWKQFVERDNIKHINNQSDEMPKKRRQHRIDRGTKTKDERADGKGRQKMLMTDHVAFNIDRQ